MNMQIFKALKDYFSQKPTVEMAFVFGSRVKDRAGLESDFDIAVYFKPKTGKLDCEDEVFLKKMKSGMILKKL